MFSQVSKGMKKKHWNTCFRWKKETYSNEWHPSIAEGGVPTGWLPSDTWVVFLFREMRKWRVPLSIFTLMVLIIAFNATKGPHISKIPCYELLQSIRWSICANSMRKRIIIKKSLRNFPILLGNGFQISNSKTNNENSKRWLLDICMSISMQQKQTSIGPHQHQNQVYHDIHHESIWPLIPNLYFLD